MQILVIMQGPSGSGKSTLANHIANVIDAEICSTDSYFFVNGVYTFDPRKLGYFHKLNQEKAEKLMREGKNVVIDNTNLTRRDVKPYVAVAVELGITVKFVRATGSFQNVHGVPAEKVEQMRQKMQDLSVESIMGN